MNVYTRLMLRMNYNCVFMQNLRLCLMKQVGAQICLPMQTLPGRRRPADPLSGESSRGKCSGYFAPHAHDRFVC